MEQLYREQWKNTLVQFSVSCSEKHRVPQISQVMIVIDATACVTWEQPAPRSSRTKRLRNASVASTPAAGKQKEKLTKRRTYQHQGIFPGHISYNCLGRASATYNMQPAELPTYMKMHAWAVVRQCTQKCKSKCSSETCMRGGSAPKFSSKMPRFKAAF